MKVKFRHSETNKEHVVKCQAQDFYILESTPMNWSSDCFVAVRKSAVDEVAEVTYQVGQRFTVGIAQKSYILASAGINKVMLVNLDTGAQWCTDFLSVRDSSNITKAELDRFSPHMQLISGRGL